MSCGQADGHCGPAAWWTFNTDGPVMRLDQALRGWKSQAGAAGLGGKEWREQFLSHVGGNAWSAVAEHELTAIADDAQEHHCGDVSGSSMQPVISERCHVPDQNDNPADFVGVETEAPADLRIRTPRAEQDSHAGQDDGNYGPEAREALGES